MRLLWFRKDPGEEVRLQKISEMAGQLALGKWGPRAIDVDERVEAMHHHGLLLAGAEVVKISLDTGRPVKEVIEMYTEAVERLRNWYSCADLEAEVEKVLDENVVSPWDYKERPIPKDVLGRYSHNIRTRMGEVGSA